VQEVGNREASVALYDRKRRAAFNIPRLNSTGRGWPLLGSLIVRASFWGPKRRRNPSSSWRKAG